MKQRVSKDIAVTALITNASGDILIVKPSYKDGWILPGGYVEIGESPSYACQREIQAELGVEIQRPVHLRSVDYHCHTNEYVMFTFDGGVFTDEMIAKIKLPARLTAYRFVSVEEALTLLRPNSARRLPSILAAKQKGVVAYLEQQNILSSE